MTPTGYLERCSDPVLICDLSGVVVWGNSSARRLLGCGEAIPALAAFLPEDDRKQVLSTDNFNACEVQLQAADRNRVPQTVIVSSIGSGDPDAEALLLIFKSCSIPWQQRRMREDLLATITHDLKNPLGAVFGYADALLDTSLGKNLDAAQKRVLAKIRSTAARSIELVRNCELLFRLGLASPRTMRPVNMNVVVAQVLEGTWREEAESPPLRIQLSTAELPVVAESTQLDRIIANLFTNALKYTPRTGEIRISTRKEGARAVFDILNTGVCIPSEELPKIFDKYSRGSTSGGVAGTGLGLYITKMLVDILKGTIEVQSDQGRGTRFTVRVPLA